MVTALWVVGEQKGPLWMEIATGAPIVKDGSTGWVREDPWLPENQKASSILARGLSSL
jgi:hypothetical protein